MNVTDQDYTKDLDREVHIIYGEWSTEQLRDTIERLCKERRFNSAGRDLQEMRRELRRRSIRIPGQKRGRDYSKADQPDVEPVYMSASQAAWQLIEAKLSGEIKIAAAARVGREDQKLWYGKIKDLTKTDLGKEPHSLVVPSKLHFTEREFLESL